MKPMITISLTKEQATRLVKVLYDNGCQMEFYESEEKEGSFKELLNDLVDLLEVKPWDLYI